MILPFEPLAIDCQMGQWGAWEQCLCDQGTCGTCYKSRAKEVIKQCAHNGNCDCEREEDEKDCSIPCRKCTLIYLNDQKQGN